MRFFLLASFSLFIWGFLGGQTEGTMMKDSTSYISMQADSAIHASLPFAEMDTLNGNVIMVQDSLFMFCNRAIVTDQIFARAYENVIIIHHDTIQFFGDSMIYDGSKKIATLYGEVILMDGNKRLYTSEMTYDVDKKIAHFDQGGTLINQGDTIVCKEGFYFNKKREVMLSGNVSFNDSTRTLNTDSILYFYDKEQLNIIAPTKIDQDSLSIYCESGIYRLEEEQGILSSNVQVLFDSAIITSELLEIRGSDNTYTFLIQPKIIDQQSIAFGDTIVYNDSLDILEIRNNAVYRSDNEEIMAPLILYDRESGQYSTVGRANVVSGDNEVIADRVSGEDSNRSKFVGNVKIKNQANNISLKSDAAERIDAKLVMYSYNTQSMLMQELAKDSLFIAADTLISEEIKKGTDSTSQVLKAINNVKIKNANTYGLSNQFRFGDKDSVIVLWGSPVLWTDSVQLTSDTILMHIKDKEVSKIELINNALVIAPDSLGGLNHMKGHHIVNFIDGRSISELHIHGNSELFYLIEKDGEYEGINLTRSSAMVFNFENNEIKEIRMQGVPESEMFNYSEIHDISTFYLEGFNWRINEIPADNIFEF